MSGLLPAFLASAQGLGLGSGSRVLLALSGGLDSTVLFRLMAESGLSFAAAHVNYGLRGADSDADEAFCRALCEENGVSCYVCRAAEEMRLRPPGLSVQEAAREIRYRFFGELCAAHGFTHIVTAHHANDAAETFFINLLRGSGIQGLRGIPAVNGAVVRPLLAFPRKDLEAFAAERGLSHREDASNQKDAYLRNRIRRHVWPAVEGAAAGALPRLAATMERLSREAELLDVLLAAHFPADTARTDMAAVLYFPEGLRATVLFRRFQKLGLSYAQAQELAAALTGIPGKMFLTPGHRLLVDRGAILAEALVPGEEAELLLYENGHIPGYTVSVVPVSDARPDGDAASAFLDADTLSFPLSWRKIRRGDAMVPLGMKGRKKVSDILTDSKTDRFAKERLHVLCSGDEIVWLEGRRPADSSKLTAQTCRVLCIIPEKL